MCLPFPTKSQSLAIQFVNLYRDQNFVAKMFAICRNDSLLLCFLVQNYIEALRFSPRGEEDVYNTGKKKNCSAKTFCFKSEIRMSCSMFFNVATAT